LRKSTALLCVTNPPLAGYILTLLQSRPELDVVIAKGDCARSASRLRPPLILLGVELPTPQAAEAFTRLRTFSPASRVIAISGMETACFARQWGADACLRADELRSRLWPTVRKLIATSRNHANKEK
jgi:hypothetical protein